MQLHLRWTTATVQTGRTGNTRLPPMFSNAGRWTRFDRPVQEESTVKESKSQELPTTKSKRHFKTTTTEKSKQRTWVSLVRSSPNSDPVSVAFWCLVRYTKSHKLYTRNTIQHPTTEVNVRHLNDCFEPHGTIALN